MFCVVEDLTDLVREITTEAYGPRCTTYEPECPTCVAHDKVDESLGKISERLP